ncbi:MAG: hypothetical protein IH571_04610 [Acholeplasmataceae bacterium]|nr:hypothetical protein [Acholeplasmataceae bacterium]
MTKIWMFFKRYRTLNRRVDKYTQVNSVFKSVSCALLLSTLAMLIPFLIVINMFIYTKLRVFLAILIVLFSMSWAFLYYFFYYRLLKNYHTELEDINTKIPQLTESIFVSTIFLIIGFVVIFNLF